MESERKIEKLLRAYAKKRRAQSGEPLKLHPADRRILQNEVARNAPKPGEEDAFVSLWELFRQRWALLAGFALIVFFGASLFLPALSSAKKKAQSVSAMANLKQIGLAAQMAANENNGKLPASLEALTNQLGSDRILTDAESGKRFIYIAGGENLDDLPSNSVIAYSPTDKKERAVLFSDGRVEAINGAQFSELTNRKLTQLAVANASLRDQPAEALATTKDASGSVAAAPSISGQSTFEENQNAMKLAGSQSTTLSAGIVVANAPAAAATAVDQLVTASGSAGNYNGTQSKSVQFGSAASQKSALNMQNSFQNTAVQAKMVPVLANFQVQQNGNAIRVVDADGSVYDGSLQPEGVIAQSSPGQTATLVPLAGEPEQIERKKIVAKHDESKIQLQTAQNYFFRVSGLNQTLKQNVVFAGNLLANSNAITNVQQSFIGGVGGSQLQSALTNQLPWSNSRITGTAVVSDTNNIEINAVPLSP